MTKLIGNNFTKRKRWNAKTRNYELLDLNCDNHTRDEALVDQIDYELEHGWALGLDESFLENEKCSKDLP
jgi:hypothetical protein